MTKIRRYLTENISSLMFETATHPVDPCLHAITKPVVLAVWQIAIVYYTVNVVL